MKNIKDYIELKPTFHARKLNFKANLMNNNQLTINVDTKLKYRHITNYMNGAKLD